MICSVSHTAAACPVKDTSTPAYAWAKVDISPTGEYFLSITSPDTSVKISMGIPSRIFSVRRISLGMTTRPRSSILRTIPVAFIPFLPKCSPPSPDRACVRVVSICQLFRVYPCFFIRPAGTFARHLKFAPVG